MKKLFQVFGMILLLATVFGMFADANRLFAQLEPRPGCCMQRDWLASEWRKTRLSFRECERLNANRDNLDDFFAQTGYVWWDEDCVLPD
jgi:hypothetical protein